MTELLQQATHQSRQELIKSALEYFWQLKSKQNLPSQKARQMVLQKTGVIL